MTHATKTPHRGGRTTADRTGFGRVYGAPSSYSPTFGEGEFCELRLRGSVNSRVANVTTVGQEAIQSFGELSGKKSSQPIDGSSKQSSLRSRVNKGVGILSPRPQLYVFPLIRSELRPRPPPSGARILLRLPFGDPCRHALSCLVSLRSPARSVWFLRLVLLLPWLDGGASDPSAD